MVYISVDDFYEKVSSFSVMNREEELECAKQMKTGDAVARERMIQSYLPMVAAHIRHTGPDMQRLGLVYSCLKALESAVDSFDFFQGSEPFSHRLSWHLRQAVTSYIADSRDT